MKIVIPGGTGQIGRLLKRSFEASHDEVIVLGRSPAHGVVQWDGKTLGPWSETLDGADVVINLAGRTVDCRYTAKNVKQMMDSRVDSTRVIGQAIARVENPPRTWLQMSTATIYAHRFDVANDEATGIIGGSEPDVPSYWRQSIEIANAWEATLAEAHLPSTRRVALRSAMVMSADRGGVFSVLAKMTRARLGGAIGSGRQYVSWIHVTDFINAIRFLIEKEDLDGPVNLAAPQPLPQREFQRQLRNAMGIRLGLPATKWMAEIGAFALRTDTELLLKSRRVIPGRLQDAGFQFKFEDWQRAARDLASA